MKNAIIKACLLIILKVYMAFQVIEKKHYKPCWGLSLDVNQYFQYRVSLHNIHGTSHLVLNTAIRCQIKVVVV